MKHANTAYAARKLMLDSYRNGDFKKSIDSGQKLIDSYVLSKTPPTIERADDFYNFAFICAEAGDYRKAIDLYTKSYVTVRTMCGENHDYTARLTNLAICYAGIGSSDIAVGLFKKADEILSELKSYAKNDWISYDHRNNLYNLANAYDAAGMHELAAETHEKQLSLYPLNDVIFADSLNCIGYTFEKREKHEVACRYFADALKIKKHICGEYSEEYIADLVHYAEALVCADNHKTAMNVFMRAAGFIKKAHTEADNCYIQVVEKAAECAIIIGELDKALKLRRRILKIIKSIMGETHLIYSEALRNVSTVYKQMGELEKALKYILRALNISRLLLGEGNALYEKDVALACDLYMRLNMFDKAAELLGKNKVPHSSNL